VKGGGGVEAGAWRKDGRVEVPAAMKIHTHTTHIHTQGCSLDGEVSFRLELHEGAGEDVWLEVVSVTKRAPAASFLLHSSLSKMMKTSLLGISEKLPVCVCVRVCVCVCVCVTLSERRCRMEKRRGVM
jgi:hypothetical protein